jgi:hypothetical protein
MSSAIGWKLVAWSECQKGNVAALREFDRILEKNDALLGHRSFYDGIRGFDQEPSAPKLGKKELAEQAAATAGDDTDWEERLLSIPALALNNEEAERALRIVCGDWTFQLVRAIFGSFDPATRRQLIREFFVLIPEKEPQVEHCRGDHRHRLDRQSPAGGGTSADRRAELLEPRWRGAIEQRPVEGVVHARIGQHVHERHVGLL